MWSATFTGKRLRLVLGIRGYELETASDSHDKNWLMGNVALEVGSPPEQVFTAHWASARH